MARRRRDPGRLLRHQRLLVVLRLPAVPREPRRRRGRGARGRRGSTGCGTTSTTPASWSRSSTPPSPRWPSCRTASARSAHLVFVTHSIPDAMNDDAAARDGGAYVAPAPQRRGRGRRAGAAGDRAPVPHELVFCSRSGPAAVPWLEPDVNDHLEELAKHGRQRRGAGADRVRLRPHGGHLRPRHRGARHGAATSGCPPCGRRPPGSTRGSWRWSATCWSSGPPPSAARSRPGPPSAACRRRGTVCPAGCCPNPRGDRAARRWGRARERADDPADAARPGARRSPRGGGRAGPRAPARRRRPSPTPRPAPSTSSPRPTGRARS